MSKKGEELLEKYRITKNEGSEELPEKILQKRNGMMESLQELNKDLPDEIASRRGIEIENVELWKKHASTCVSCGACSFICPTCHCFLLIDKENFEKVKNWDVCQFPSFAKVAAGEDPLKKLYDRLKYRYLCKFIYKPDMFKAIACTGCGRCTDTCIGKINKNEVIKEACK
jgi:ferredoxin